MQNKEFEKQSFQYTLFYFRLHFQNFLLVTMSNFNNMSGYYSYWTMWLHSSIYPFWLLKTLDKYNTNIKRIVWQFSSLLTYSLSLVSRENESLSVFELTPICFCLQSFNGDVMYDRLDSKFRTIPCCLRNPGVFVLEMYCIFLMNAFLQETKAYPAVGHLFCAMPSCLHVRVFPGPKRDNTLRRATMSPEAVQKCYYL